MNLTFPCPAAPFLPHQGAMCLIDTLLAAHEDCVRVAWQVRRDQGSHWALEYLAQSVGVFSGVALAMQGLPPKIGLLIGCRKLDCARPQLRAGELFHAEARLLLNEPDGLSAFACMMWDAEGALFAQTEIKAYRPDNIHQYFASRR